MTTPTAALAAQGVSIWLDDLSRTRITSGNLAELIAQKNVTGVTTNPTIQVSARIGNTLVIQPATGAAMMPPPIRPSTDHTCSRRPVVSQ